ncbi:NUDIX domain-containing protein [Streptomyces sp. NPDC048638]|uniref:NUDIX domain-containing protein n=1 Tax=Streptomyces sp. NPDC048638 TaxID=3365580 RepID=UPI003714FA90
MTETATPTIRNSAKAVVLHTGRVLLQRATWEGQDCFFLPGGGQEPGEDLEATVCREVFDETGVTVRVVRLLWVREYIGANHENAATEADTHRVEMIFECVPVGEPGPLGGHDEDEVQTELEWAELGKVPGLNLLPHALRQPIAELAADGPETGYLGDVA